MNLDQIETKCFILALFIRDDGERFLLGSRAYEFVDSQLHFAANSYQNDVVEVQGNDGLMLAGQVRRATSQAFDGYIGDSSVNRSTIEQYRRDFMKFFRKNHYYKVVYVFPDGTAVQRRNGFIVEAPEVKELYQLFPKYHISMNFEDINYYNYEEDSEGEEIYGESAALKIATAATGGLIWSNSSSSTLTGEGTNFTLEGTVNGNAISDVQLKGDTTQQTYSGKNLFAMPSSQTVNGVTMTVHNDGTFDLSGTASATGIFYVIEPLSETNLIGGDTYTLHIPQNMQWTLPIFVQSSQSDGTYSKQLIAGGLQTGTSKTVVLENPDTQYVKFIIQVTSGSNYNLQNFYVQLESGSSPTSYEPYVGGIPAPNPDYPQEVQVVTGEQTVTITDGAEESQSYEVNLGKNLFDKNSPNLLTAFVNYSEGEIQSSATAKTVYIPITGGETYTVSKMLSSRFTLGTTANVPAIGEPLINKLQNNSATVLSLAASDTANYLCVDFYRSAEDTATIEEIMSSIQIEKGSTATTYAPYFTPIELCKIGEYQDYIYQSGSDWYVHKAIGKVDFGALTWTATTSAIRGTVDIADIKYVSSNTEIGSGIAQKYIIRQGSGLASYQNYIAIDTAKVNVNTGSSSIDPTGLFYYALATATDTQITNADLVSQLNALAGATTYNGQTVFTVTSDNQLAILSLSTIGDGGGGVVWDQYGAEWEEGTGGGPTMISVESIDNVYPVWELTGPATNPQISVLTTNTTLSYSGTITASQTLKIDMFNKTATLNGTSVVGNVSGDWVYLAPGTNRVTYTTGNADAPDSTIWWQEIVG